MKCDVDYGLFVEMVNAACLDLAGVSLNDLPDIDLTDWYYEEMTLDEAKHDARDCACEILELGGYDIQEETEEEE